MRHGTYLRDQDGRLHCRHGLILHGDACVQCERDALTAAGLAAQLRWADAKPFESRIRGRSADRIILDDPWSPGGPDPKDLADSVAFFADALHRRGWDFAGDPRPRPQHWNCRSTIKPSWGDGTPLTEEEADLINGRYRGQEIITDAADTRGLNAKPVRRAA